MEFKFQMKDKVVCVWEKVCERMYVKFEFKRVVCECRELEKRVNRKMGDVFKM